MAADAPLWKSRCFRYGIPANCFLAIHWCNDNPDMAPAEIAVIVEGDTCRIRLTDLTAGVVLVANAENNVMRVPDSTRYFVMMLEGKLTGIGLFSRDDSKEFQKRLLEKLHLQELPVFSLDSQPQDSYFKGQVHVMRERSPPPSKPQQIKTKEKPLIPLPSVAANSTDVISTGPFSFSPPTETSEILEKVDPESEIIVRSRSNRLNVETENSPAPTESVLFADRASAEAHVEALADSAEKAPEPPPEAQRPVRKHEDEDFSQPQWYAHRKHVFVISDAGKPIYSRYGDELRLAPFCGSLFGFVSFVATYSDTIRYFTAGEQQFVFLKRGPLIYVVISKTGECVPELLINLEYVHSQIVAILTYSGIQRLFKSQKCDLRLLLPDRNRHLDRLIHEINRNPSLMLKAAQPMPMPQALRNKIGQIISQRTEQDMLFAIMFCNYQLINIARPKRYPLDPMDLHIAMNFVNSTSSFRSSEIWVPLCLPKFDDKGCMHAYVRYITKDICLMLFSTKFEHYPALQQYSAKVQQDLQADNTLQALQNLCEKPYYRVTSTNIPNLLHFMYLSKSNKQLTTPPALDAPYIIPAETKRLYTTIRDRAETDTQPHKMYISSTQKETIVVWVTAEFELYATVGPLEAKQNISKICSRLASWIEEEEGNLLILEPPLW